jgi:peptidoglycan-N-acetylglucosamine deacetylase
MRPLGWNVDSKDFERPGADAIVATVKNEIADGPTVLLHDAGGDRSQTVVALREVLPWLKQQGYSFGFPVRRAGLARTDIRTRAPGPRRRLPGTGGQT